MRKHLYNKPLPHIQPNYISDTSSIGTIFRSLVLNGKKEAALSICLSDGRRRVCPSVGCHIIRLEVSYMCEPNWSGREYGTPCTIIVSLFHDKQDWYVLCIREFSRKPKLNCRQTVSGNNSFFKTQSWLFERFCAFSNMKPNSQSGGTIKFLLL